MADKAMTGKRILVVDDEPSVVTYLETLLQDNGFETLAAGDGQEAMAVTRAERPDLVTLDITMPKKSGIRYYRELKEDAELASTPVVVVTAVTGYGGKPEEFEKFLSTRKQIPPPDAFVAKPIDRDKFIQTIRDALG
ncbi:response regulator [Candidatus Sumerlaeota bacterium]